MAASVKVAPWTHDLIMPLLSASAAAAAKSCTGGATGAMCGTKWTEGTFDGAMGVGQQMNALEIFQSNLIDAVRGPVGNKTGGTSVGNPDAGTGGDKDPIAPQSAITTADRAGAGILTAMILIGAVGGAWWMIS
jgi:mannan endo-1,6-alpha-mannosidase